MRFARGVLLYIFAMAGFAFVFLVLPQLIWVGFLGKMMFTQPPPSALNLPIYPDAQQVVQEPPANGITIVTFQTPDKPHEVLAYYRQVLRNDSWVNPLINGEYPENIFEWHQGGPDGPTALAYRLMMTFDTSDDQMTKVEILLLQFDPIHYTSDP
ncbi:MAG TPA: hypothetical protein VGE45_14025 [Chloroflexia bacterium]|jgi:hypothetical protein